MPASGRFLQSKSKSPEAEAPKAPKPPKPPRPPFISLMPKWTHSFIVFIVLMLLSVGGIMVLQGMVDTNQLRAQIIKELKAKTGQDVFIRGNINVSLMPRPVAYVTGLELRNPDPKSNNPEVSVEIMGLYMNFFSVLSDMPTIHTIAMQRPALEVVRDKDKNIKLGWLNTGFLKNLLDANGQDTAVDLQIAEGRIAYRDSETEQTSAITGIYASGNTGRPLWLEGEATLMGMEFQFIVDTKTGDKVAAGAQPLNVRLFSDEKNYAEFKGGIDLRESTPKINGAFTVESDNLRNFTVSKSAKANELSPTENILAKDQEKAAQNNLVLPPLPMKFTSDWVQNGADVELHNSNFQGLNSAGTGSISLSWSGAVPSYTVEMAFKALDYNQWESLFGELLRKPQTKQLLPSTGSSNFIASNPLPTDLHMMVYLDIDQVFLGTQTLRNAKISAALADAAITVNQFNVVMPGDAAVTLFGVISEGNAAGLRFEGSMEVQGKSLRQMLALVDKSATNLPKGGFEAFSSRSNVFISSTQIRLSEANFKINDLRLDGGLVVYFDAKPRLEADVKLQDINFDYFRDIWRETHPDANGNDYFLKFDRGTNWGFLRKLYANIDFKVIVDNFTFLERKGSRASFRLTARDGEIGLYNMRLNYDRDTLDANISLNVRNELPMLNVQMNATELRTDYFLPLQNAAAKPATMPVLQTPEGAPPAAAPVPPPPAPEKAEPAAGVPVATVATAPVVERAKRVWSEDLIDLSWMDSFNGSFDLSIGKLIHRGMTINNLKFRGKQENNSLSFKNATFTFWDGKCSLTGQIYGGSVPGISMSYTLFDSQFRDILRDLTGYENISGRVSASGTLATSGVNMLSWVSQADATVVLAGRGIAVDELSLRGVVDAVRVSRTASDVFNNANIALKNGKTEFTVDGTLNLKGGIVRTPGITLGSGVANGTANGELRLIPWRIESLLQFRFPLLSAENPPTMTMQISGPIESPQVRNDTSSLEAYVAKQIIGH